MGKSTRKNPKGQKTLSVKDLPVKPNGGEMVRGGVQKVREA